MTRKEIIGGLKFTVDMFLFDPSTGETFTEPRNDMDKTTIDACKGAIELLEQTRWIPVSERLPKDEEYVLVCYEDGLIRTAYYYIDTNIYPSEFEDCCETGWYNYNEDFMYKQDVVAWMPLPELYKAESEEE